MAGIIDIRHDCSSIPMLYLDGNDIDRTLGPKPHVVEMVAMLTPRCGDQSRPGFVVLPNPADLFPSKLSQRSRLNGVMRYQYLLMLRLLRCLKTERPEALIPQDYLALPKKEAVAHYKKAKPGIKPMSIDGRSSYKTLHMDALQHVAISFCHHPRKNISGGAPVFLDLYRAFGNTKAANATHIVPGNHIYHPKERAVLLSTSHEIKARKHELVIEGLDYDKIPIIIASNRHEDGIMHGATAVRQINKNDRWSRNISYVAIKCC